MFSMSICDVWQFLTVLGLGSVMIIGMLVFMYAFGKKGEGD